MIRECELPAGNCNGYKHFSLNSFQPHVGGDSFWVRWNGWNRWVKSGVRASPMLMPLPHDMARVVLCTSPTYVHIYVFLSILRGAFYSVCLSDLPKSLQSGVLMFHFSQHKSPGEAREAEAAAQV